MRRSTEYAVTFLPIVERELRVASRRGAIFRLRFLGAAAATLGGGLYLLATPLPGPNAMTGRTLFLILTCVALALALLAGVGLTADSISREKREGTLGLLFLTDLGGFDVVAGKFAALALGPLQTLLAVFPVAALSLLMGGVSGGEFWRVSVGVLNAMFLALALGMWVSSAVRESGAPLGAALSLLAIVTAAPVFLEWVSELMPALGWLGWAGLASPISLIRMALGVGGRAGVVSFGGALLFQHGLAWGFLATAAVMTRQGWREPGRGGQNDAGQREALEMERSSREFGRRRSRRSGARRWLAWQGLDGRRRAWGVAWTVLAGATTVFVGMVATGERFRAGPTSMMIVSGGMYLLKLLLAGQVAFSLQDRCRNGSMELLLVTPVSSRALWEGQLAALRAIYLRPFLALGAGYVVLAAAGTMAVGGDWPSRTNQILAAIGLPLVGVAVHGCDFLAVAHHAARWALTYDRPWKAFLRTSVMMLALPAVFCSYGRVVVDLVVIGQERPRLEAFRELVRRWYFPGVLGPGWGVPRT